MREGTVKFSIQQNISYLLKFFYIPDTVWLLHIEQSVAPTFKYKVNNMVSSRLQDFPSLVASFLRGGMPEGVHPCIKVVVSQEVGET